MTFPAWIRVGTLAVHPHQLLETLAWGAALAAYVQARRRHTDVIDPRGRWLVTIAAVLGGLLGSRLLYVLEDPTALARQWSEPAYLSGGKTVVGGLIGGVLAVEWAKARLGMRIATGDLFVVPLLLGIGIGRVGCFLTGLDDATYGVATSLPWGVDFGDGIPRHPTQLYEVAFLAVFGAWLVTRVPADTPPGTRFAWLVVGYMAFRLGVDFLKPGARVGGLTVIQWAALATLAYYLPRIPRLFAEVRHRPEGRPT